MLVYTSHRPAHSGLLGVMPLGEEQVAEYRFWTDCGVGRSGRGSEGEDLWKGKREGGMKGEREARERLFRSLEEVGEDVVGHDGWGGKTGRGKETNGVAGNGEFKASIWAGGNLVTDWGRFLGGCEREGVALY